MKKESRLDQYGLPNNMKRDIFYRFLSEEELKKFGEQYRSHAKQIGFGKVSLPLTENEIQIAEFLKTNTTQAAVEKFGITVAEAHTALRRVAMEVFRKSV